MHLVTFGDGSFAMRAAAKRLVRQGQNTGLFSTTEFWTLGSLRDLDRNFFDSIESFVSEHPRGLGYWVWKPKILLETMLSLPLGEIVIMLDAGCQLNVNSESIARLNTYTQYVEEYGALFMQLQNGQFEIVDLSDNAWTKIEVLSLLDPTSKIRFTGQIQSGIILIKNTPSNQNFVSNWLQLCTQDTFALLDSMTTDKREGFVSHRWEQSILSLLVKGSNFKILPDETYFAPDWVKGAPFPIWAMRNRTGGDAFRRNFIDLSLIALARLERHLKKVLKLS